MESKTEIKKTYYTIYKGKQVGIYYGERKLLKKMAGRDSTALHKCLRTELNAIMYWYLHSNEIPTIYDVIADTTSPDGYIIVKRIDGPGLW